MDKVRVLLVGNNPDEVSLLRGMLDGTPFGKFAVEVTSTLARTIEVMSETPYDAVLLEMLLPDSAGLDTVRQIAGRFPEAAIIVMNSLNSNKLASQSVRYGAQAYLEINALSAQWLAHTIDHAIERKKDNSQRKGLLADLTAALEEIEMLRKIVPVCACCNRIHDNDNRWRTVEGYLREHRSETERFTICPECEDSLYPERGQETAANRN